MVKVQVTQAHIDKGTRFNTNSCPVALALRDAFNEKCSVFSFIHIHGYEFAQTPSSVFRRIQKFDKNTEMTPFDFEINPKRISPKETK